MPICLLAMSIVFSPFNASARTVEPCEPWQDSLQRWLIQHKTSQRVSNNHFRRFAKDRNSSRSWRKA